MVQAYSRLKTVLEQRKLTVADLRQFLQYTGDQPGLRSLARLGDETQPLKSLDLRLAGVICQVCEVPLSDLIVFRPEEGFQRITLAKQKRLDYLMDGNNNGTLTEAELEELRRMVRECEEATVHNARYLAQRHQAAPV